ncbi:trypsin CFT-1-like isoform X2 [Trichoplusia ni]|uniref:trypsin n=1 Tax=Trichoplusia ni TaxID=7111 RepID=A0A7E5W0V7_TRINI|nr:trypsin CFT-1-like isoform X2 [Trichoplusia ni]
MWWLFISLAVHYCNAQEYRITEVELQALPLEARIVGGSVTNIEKYPFAVQVIYDSQFLCGGSLLTARHVLSAAHCFVDNTGRPVSPTWYTIRLGTTLMNNGGAVHGVSAIIVHESYNTPVRDNDIAVVVLSSAARLGGSVAVHAIPVQGATIPDNSPVVAVGWGKTNPILESGSLYLQEVTVRTVNLSTCYSRYEELNNPALNEYYPVTSSMLCAGILDVGGKDACQGDSGGPLIYSGVVVGVTSWGYGCGQPRYPGVYARVASYSNWINATVARYNAGSLSSKVGVVTLLMPVLYAILNL